MLFRAPKLYAKIAFTLVVSLLILAATTQQSTSSEKPKMNNRQNTPTEIASFGAGCFWCVEAVFQNLEGVTKVESGYMGGKVKNPTYEAVCTGATGHAEIVHITFDPNIIEYKTLLNWLWRSHDPTTLNRQGADHGTQYRSAVFYHSDDQRIIAETSKTDAQKLFKDPIVTEITAASEFYPAEGYHQDYYRLNKTAPYCQMVIRPKLEKLGL